MRYFMKGPHASDWVPVTRDEFVLLAMVVSVWMVDREPFYRQGQIDALSGVVKYELVDMPDKTRVWKEKK